MKAFYKWWKKANQGGINEYHAYEGWKAALELVQSRLTFGSKVAYSTDDILMAVKKEIREELEN